MPVPETAKAYGRIDSRLSDVQFLIRRAAIDILQAGNYYDRADEDGTVKNIRDVITSLEGIIEKIEKGV